ncbi:MAG: PPOX class F420-dependent oxidoreductase [Gammaproteobacteria bacterium]|nr:PPOX class F420-dependent oxidoreductase [Gammaproteobacteria bacterium]MBI5616068.1 PPOX class F420-dependent oxidoreductase [Gammaproteobacteria bacterium]
MRDPGPALEPYVSLVTFRRDGREVATPVWIAVAGDRAYVFSAADAGKVKRLRRDARVKLAACSARGAVRGAWGAGRGTIVDDPATLARAYAALHAKYGWQMRLGDFFSKLTGRYHRRAMIEITLDPG